MTKKTSVPKVMPTPRQALHKAFCPFPIECRHQTGTKTPNLRCQAMDTLLDFNDEMLLHAKARELRDEAERVGLRRRDIPVAGGVLRGADLTDPFEMVDQFDPELDEVPPGIADHPDCVACVAGKEHFHRKSDGSPVKALTAEKDGA